LGVTPSRTVSGTSGNDRLTGSTSNDLMSGGAGIDLFWGGNGNDVLVGGSGIDVLNGEGGDNVILSGDAKGGVDSSRSIVFAGSGDDVILNMSMAARGQSVFDELYVAGNRIGSVDDMVSLVNKLQSDGDANTKAIYVGDYLRLELGNDRSVTILHWDTNGADVSGRMGSAAKSLADNMASGFVTLKGDGGKDYLTGTYADDAISGEGGDDVLMGSAGHDKLTGGWGRDSFIVGDGKDTITDFKADWDSLVVYHDFEGLGSSKSDALAKLGGEGIDSPDELLEFVRLLESDGSGQTDASISGNDLYLVFERNAQGQVVDGVRLEGVVDATVARTALYNAGADNTNSADIGAFADFDAA
jgi:Ca2+-binding RTX toxin-like protein